MNKIAIIEDDIDICNMIAKFLENNKYIVHYALNGAEGIELCKSLVPDLIILDIMLPKLNGNDVLQRLRKFTNAPVIVVSAKTMVQTKIDLLKLGADDYMTKPFDLHELLARIEANLKRTSNTSCQNDTLTYRDIEINNSLVYIKEVLVSFTSTELKILRLLLQYPQKIFSKQNLYESIWNKTYAYDDDTMDQIAVATVGSSDDLKVGEQVIAIGNALGYGQSVTTGIVSAKNRKLNDEGVEEDEDSDATNLIQTDAAINPGNSGGALLNMDGEVVGINSAKLASTEVEGMGYAIAISDVTDTLEDLMNETPRDKVDNHGVLGITGMTVSDEASQYYGIPEGVLVSEVTEGGAAEDAGIKEKSIITEFDGKRVRSIDELVSRLEYYEPGEEVEVTLEVADGGEYKEKTVTVTLDENKDTDSNKDSKDDSKDESDAEDSQDQGDGEDQSTDSLLQDFENQEEDGTAYEQFFGFLN